VILVVRVPQWLVVLALVAASAFPVSTISEPSTQLYISHAARLTAVIPGDWRVDPTGRFDYVGDDGVVRSEPLAARTLEEACTLLAESSRFDGTASIMTTRFEDHTACQFSGKRDGADVLALVVPHSHPFSASGERYAYAALFTDPKHFDAIASTLEFSSERVTPEAHVDSVLDLVEARAYWAGEVDWKLARLEAMAQVDGMTELSQTHGVLNGILQKLRIAGDYHSFMLPPERANALSVGTGFGLLLGGKRVLLVYPDGPAAKAGIRPGDVVEMVNGHQYEPPTPEAREPDDLWGLSTTLTIQRPDERVPITVAMEQQQYSRFVAPSGNRLPGDIGYIALYFVAGPPDRLAEYGTAAREVIATVNTSPTCGWVVDLRLDRGGAYSPMVGGVGPILGDGTFLGWRWRDGRQTWVTYDDGRILDDGRDIAPFLAELPEVALHRPDPPVAVLTGPLTTSSGEATTLGFVGRPHTRLFGQTTGGFTTGDFTFMLFDGTQLYLAGVAMTDRTGTTHMGGITPDELVAIDWTTYGTKHDPVVNAATAWLSEQPSCASATPVT
jgi:C-terminal processing protease CtpA/Prc